MLRHYVTTQVKIMRSELCTHGLLWEEGDKVLDMHHDVCILMLIAERLLGFFPIQRGVSQ